MTPAINRLKEGLSEVEQARGATPRRVQTGSPSRILSQEEREIGRLQSLYTEEAYQTQQLARNGNECLSRMYIDTNSVYFGAVGQVVDELEGIKNPHAQQICTNFFTAMTQNLGEGLIHNYRIGEARVKGITSRSLEPSKTKEPEQESREVTYEKKRRKIPWWPRLVGYEETWEPVD